MWHSDSYKTSPQTSEPAAIIRAALHNQSLCLFIFNFRYLLSILIFGEWGRIRQHVHTFRPLKLSRLYHFNRNINLNVSCRSVNWPLITPRHKWFRQNRTHLTTNLRLENKLKDPEYCTTFSFSFEIPHHKNGVVRQITNLPFLDIVYSRYSRSCTCYGRPTQHLLIRATGSDYKVSYPCERHVLCLTATLNLDTFFLFGWKPSLLHIPENKWKEYFDWRSNFVLLQKGGWVFPVAGRFAFIILLILLLACTTVCRGAYCTCVGVAGWLDEIIGNRYT